MTWYDWILWCGVLYTAVGSDFGLNWLTGVALGKRLDKNSTNLFNRLYYYVWASDDPMHGPIDKTLVDDTGVTAEINKSPLQPGIVALDVVNMYITLILEITILIGMFTHGAYLRPAVFMFVTRGITEIIYATQLIWGKPPLTVGALINYLIIGLIPQTLVPFFLAMRFATGLEAHILWWQPFVFIGIPLLTFIWSGMVASKVSAKLNT